MQLGGHSPGLTSHDKEEEDHNKSVAEVEQIGQHSRDAGLVYTVEN